MTVTVPLLDDLAARLAAAAAERGITPEELLAEAVEAHLPCAPSFIGLGASGRGDLSERHKEIRRELIEERRASEA